MPIACQCSIASCTWLALQPPSQAVSDYKADSVSVLLSLTSHWRKSISRLEVAQVREAVKFGAWVAQCLAQSLSTSARHIDTKTDPGPRSTLQMPCVETAQNDLTSPEQRLKLSRRISRRVPEPQNTTRNDNVRDNKVASNVALGSTGGLLYVEMQVGTLDLGKFVGLAGLRMGKVGWLRHELLGYQWSKNAWKH